MINYCMKRDTPPDLNSKETAHVPYFMDCKTHFFLRKIVSKIQVSLILEINIKMSSVWYKIPTSLKMPYIRCRGKPISIRQYWIQLAAAVHWCDEHELQGFTSLLTLSLSCPAITNPEHCRAYVASLQSMVPVNLNWKSFVLLVTVLTIFLLVASFVMEKNKRYSYDTGYKLEVI